MAPRPRAFVLGLPRKRLRLARVTLGDKFRLNLDAHQLSKRGNVKFAHHLSSMNFHRPLTNTKVRGDNFVHIAICNAFEDLPLPGRQGSRAFRRAPVDP